MALPCENLALSCRSLPPVGPDLRAGRAKGWPMSGRPEVGPYRPSAPCKRQGFPLRKGPAAPNTEARRPGEFLDEAFVGGDFAPGKRRPHAWEGRFWKCEAPPWKISVSPSSAHSVFCAAGRGKRRAGGVVPWVGGACLISIPGSPLPAPRKGRGTKANGNRSMRLTGTRRRRNPPPCPRLANGRPLTPPACGGSAGCRTSSGRTSTSTTCSCSFRPRTVCSSTR